MEKWPKCGQFK